ncbi:MAG: PAS domain S-box protein [Geobacteraceae bacterium]|nr:PAS domain S-box protein [Geobacteraceae bacterium]
MVYPSFAQLFDTEQIQRLLKAHYKITGMAAAILDRDGNVLAAAGRQDMCACIQCPHTGSCKGHRLSDADISIQSSVIHGESQDSTCEYGLRSIVLPIIVDGIHLATFTTCRFFSDQDQPDRKIVQPQGPETGLDEEIRRKALHLVPVFTRKQILDNRECFQILVHILVDMGFKNLELSREVTARKQLEEVLRQSEISLRKIFETIPDQLQIIDKDYRILAANWHGGYEYVPEEKRKHNPLCYQVFYGLDSPCGDCHMNEVFTTGKPVTREKFHPKIGHVEIRSFPIFDEMDEVVMLLEHIRDINTREALRESGQRLSATIQGSPMPMFVLGKDQKIIYWNKALEQLSGTRADEFIGTDLAWTAFYDEERPLLANLLSKGDTALLSQWYAGKCSKSRLVEDAYEVTDFFPKWGDAGKWLHLTAAALRDTKGNLTGALQTLEDVTERKLAEDKWRSLFNNLPGGSFTENNNYVIEEVNDVLCAVTGFSREELVGQLCGIICPKGPHLCPILDLDKERIDNDETAVKGKDGRHVPIIKSARRIPVGNREVIVENFQDITDRKHLEEQLRHAQKMDAIGQLAGGVAHDFNNILTAIIGYGNLLQMKIGKNEPLEKYVNQIMYSAERAANLTNRLLAFSRKHVINLKAVMLNEVIYRAEKLLSRLVRENIEFRVVTGKDCIVRADSVQIEQILMNLVTNARDAMPGGGSLVINTERVDLDKDFVRIHGYGEPGTYVLISVSDTGFGMDVKTRERIFEPFFTTKETGKGTGLGLAIVYGIIKQHNGYINVDSEPGIGTTFKIYLPVVTADTETVELFEMAVPRNGSETVLLAEDDPTVRGLTKSVLEEFGYLVIEAVDGADAIEKFRLNEEVIQLLILDVMMPKKNGKETYKEIKKIQPGIKALFMSGYTDDILGSAGVLEDNVNFISKPFTQNVLLQKTREVLEKRVFAEHF